MALYKIGLSSYAKDIWLIAVYYFLISLITLILYRRLQLVNKPLFFFIHFSSIGIVFWVYQTALKFGPEAILPDAGNFKTEWWFIVLGYFYSLLNSFSPNYTIEYQRKNKFLLERYRKLKQKYNTFLSKKFKDNKLLNLIFYSIMITEDINRPPFIRLLEKTLFFTGKIKTTGIMQVTNKKNLSDLESIAQSELILYKSYLKHYDEATPEYEVIIKIAKDYNPGSYGSEISETYITLQNILSK